MRVIDAHVHVLPEALTRLSSGERWCGFSVLRDAAGERFLERGNRRTAIPAGDGWTPERLLGRMDSLGVDVALLTPWSGLYDYRAPAPDGIASARACNDHVAALTQAWPARFAGLGTLPMQDVPAAVGELERAVTELGLMGAIIGDHVDGRTYDAPEFVPFWRTAERLGALILFHQAPGDSVVEARSRRYGIGDGVGTLADRTVTFATLAFGGVLDDHPRLRLCLCHAGGYACFGAGRLDRAWQVRPEARERLKAPPSRYLRRFYYDCLAPDEGALRFLIGAVGADRVVLGTGWPGGMDSGSPVRRIANLEALTPGEKAAILGGNLAGLLGW